MKTQVIPVWTNADFLEGHCGMRDIGQPRMSDEQQEVAEVAEVLDALPAASMAELKQAALRVARGKMGFDKFFETYPAFHHKMLLAMVKESTPPSTAPINVNLSWISPNRLSYKRDTPLELIEGEPPKE